MNTYQSLEQLHHLLQEIQRFPTEDDFQEAFGIIEELREPYLVMLEQVEEQLYERPFRVCANGTFDAPTDSFLDAYERYLELLSEGADNVHIVDSDFEIIVGLCDGRFYPIAR